MYFQLDQNDSGREFCPHFVEFISMSMICRGASRADIWPMCGLQCPPQKQWRAKDQTCSASEGEGEEGHSTMALVQDPDFLSKRSPSKEGRPEGHLCSRADPGSVALTQRAGMNVAMLSA